MQAFASLTLLITLIVSLVVGARLLWVARRTRRLPELLFGLGFLGGGIGQAFGQIGKRAIWTTPGSLATLLDTVCFLLVVLSTVALYGAIWRVFRAQDWRGTITFWCGTFAVLAGWGMRIANGDFATGSFGSTGHLVYFLARISLFVWAAMEAFAYYALLRRRLKLGLADPMAANQILLWGFAGVFSALLTITIGHYMVTVRRSPLEDPLGTTAVLVLALATSATMWCSFFPPASLVHRLKARSGA